MPNRQNSHIAAIARDFALYLMDQGYSEQHVFAGTGLTLDAIREDGAQAPLPDIIAVFNRGRALTGNDLIGFEWGKIRRSDRMGLIGYMGRTSPTLERLLLNLARYRRVFSKPIEMDVSRLASEGAYVWTYRLPKGIDPTQFVESQATHMVVGFTRAIQKHPRPRSLAFEHHRPRNREVIERFFVCPVQFGAPRNEIVFDTADLKRPIVTSDEALNKILLEHCELVLSQTPPDSSDVRIQVERAIADRLSAGQATQDQIARDIGVSPRTLARRLGDAGTSYHKVLADLRRALAERYLRDGQVTQSEIAYLLGYADVSSFATAFKRWTGHSPGGLRKVSEYGNGHASA
ncbi:AraC family transcriptional regulator [Shimia abyssi]|uniref:AraC family transcriptional regulator n=1 Tax=Shimia abyssi TaxID=1662395 RepID=A0A2P8FJL2_9RHOB|nr:AraC family transcriptional regulator [Shimia abyssi]PSL21910.1 AraC family transcriptional regulator [Shimia abyssi]